MGKPAARVGDMTAHGGMITGPGVPNVLIGGMPAATMGDMHVCPMVTPGVPPIPHVGGPLVGPVPPTVLIGGKPAACVGDMAICVGPPSSILPPGCPTVLFGQSGGG
ncbi:MAG TPA: PAAR domain-containing protein, partial [Chitinispirillaceae bacterium]|nr:PAAR domain-containing protein [Chitinispirillaceae bacterium]